MFVGRGFVVCSRLYRITWSARAAICNLHPTLHCRAVACWSKSVASTFTRRPPLIMARLSTSQAFAEAEQSEDRSVSAEGVMDSEEEEEGEEEGTIMEQHSTPKRRRLNADARHSNGNEGISSHQGAMGQAESRETLRSRNAALHRAGQEARVPRGKLPRISGGSLRALSARQRLPGNPLASANTFDLPSDDEEEVLPKNVRHTPIQRPSKRGQSALYKSPAQAQIDQQLGVAADNEVEDDVEPESDGQLEDHPAVEQPQQSGSGKRGRGRPRKSIQVNADGKRRRGRPSKQNQPDDQTREQSIQSPTSVVAEANIGSATHEPSTTTRIPKSKSGRRARADVAAEASLAQRDSNSHVHHIPRTARVNDDNIEAATGPAVPAASTSDAGQPGNDANQAVTGFGDRHVNGRANNHIDEQQQAGSVAQSVVVGDAKNDDYTSEESEKSEGSEECGDGDDDVEAEEHIVLSSRLHGHWESIQELVREAAKHRDERFSIPDKTFKAALRDCKRTVRTVRATTADIDADELEQITSECRNVVSRAAQLCGDNTPMRNRGDRGYHISKFLMPALVRLLKAVIEAFERVDIEGAGQPQIYTHHLATIINLIYTIWTCGDSAYHQYKSIDRPVKKEVHAEITLRLRALHDKLEEFYTSRLRAEREREQALALSREIEAKDQKRERAEQRRRTEQLNRDKWRKMNTARWEVGKNSWDLKKLNHLRSCPSALVETNEAGQPFLPAYLRQNVETFTMRELAALREGLIKHVDTPSPLKSEVFENLMREYCCFGGELAARNTLEVVRQANDLRFGLIQLHEKNGTEVPRWVWQVPVWMDPVRR